MNTNALLLTVLNLLAVVQAGQNYVAPTGGTITLDGQQSFTLDGVQPIYF